MPCGRALPALASLLLGCAPPPAPQGAPLPDLSALFVTAPPAATPAPDMASSATPPTSPEPPAPPAPPAPPEAPCATDEECGYDPTSARCGVDPRYNKQPPLVDQGIVCYCDAPTRACALLRVDPAPCEGDTSCAVRLDPRPHPVRADAGHPHVKPPRCRSARAGKPHRTDRFATCERTNICTLHARECASP